MTGPAGDKGTDAEMRVIDAHVHVWSADQLRYPFGPHDGLAAPTRARTPGDYRREGGAAEMLLIQPRVYGYDHAFAFECAQRLSPAARVMPLINAARADSLATVRHFAARAETAAFRVIALGDRPARWLSSPQALRTWRLAADLGTPIGLLVDPPQLAIIAQVAEHYPDLALVIDHLGRCRPGQAARYGPALLALARCPNVHVKLSALGALSGLGYPYRDKWPLLASLYRDFGPSRLLWGSDWPYARRPELHRRARAAICQALPAASRRDREAIFATTAARLFGFSRAEVTGGPDGNP